MQPLSYMSMIFGRFSSDQLEKYPLLRVTSKGMILKESGQLQRLLCKRPCFHLFCDPRNPFGLPLYESHTLASWQCNSQLFSTLRGVYGSGNLAGCLHWPHETKF